MKFLAIILTFLGYVLVYASVANSGKFATQPWMGVLSDAYATGGAAPGSTSGGSGGANAAPSVQNRKTPTITNGRGGNNKTPSHKQVLNSMFGQG